MSEEVIRRAPVFEDSRGRLIPVEFDDVPFVPRRVFVVSGGPGQSRGGHQAKCKEFLVLLSGCAVVRLESPGSRVRTYELKELGSSLLVSSDEFVEYILVDSATTMLVLADRPYHNMLAGEQ